MATRRDLANDPNMLYDDQSVMRRVGQKVRGGLETTARALNAPLPGTRELGMTQTIQGANSQIARGIDDFIAGAAPEAAAAPTSTQTPSAKKPRRAPNPDAEAMGQQAGSMAASYLGARKALAPGVRRWGSETADPSDVYMSVDKNGNRVYTDNAAFAARQSKGSLSRRDLAPGMTDYDADRTLNDPEGGYTYAPASQKAVGGLRRASQITGGGSQYVERALSEAQRAQAIADTRAGTRDIDKRREEQGAMNRRRMGLDDGGPDVKTLLALQAANLAERKFGYEQERDQSTAARDAKNRQIDDIGKVVDLFGTDAEGNPKVPPELAQRLLGSALGGPEDVASPVGRGAQYASEQAVRSRLRKNRGFFDFLSDEDIDDVDLTKLRMTEDGLRAQDEDAGLFDITRDAGIEVDDRTLGDPEMAEFQLRYAQWLRNQQGR